MCYPSNDIQDDLLDDLDLTPEQKAKFKKQLARVRTKLKWQGWIFLGGWSLIGFFLAWVLGRLILKWVMH